MATPWDRLTDDSYRQWLEKAMTPEEYNRSSVRERRGLLTDFETDSVQKQQQQQQQQQPNGKLRCFRILVVVKYWSLWISYLFRLQNSCRNSSR